MSNKPKNIRKGDFRTPTNTTPKSKIIETMERLAHGLSKRKYKQLKREMK